MSVADSMVARRSLTKLVRNSSMKRAPSAKSSPTMGSLMPNSSRSKKSCRFSRKKSMFSASSSRLSSGLNSGSELAISSS
ncbi:hypothetical protein D3C83_37330 [compost metagenome]